MTTMQQSMVEDIKSTLEEHGYDVEHKCKIIWKETPNYLYIMSKFYSVDYLATVLRTYASNYFNFKDVSVIEKNVIQCKKNW